MGWGENYIFRNNKNDKALSITRITRIGFMCVNLKAQKGRGRKRYAWLKILHKYLKD